MSKWLFNDSGSGGSVGSFYMDFNPATDTGFQEDPIIAEQHAIAANSTVLQIGGFKSRNRVAEGITKSATVKANLDALLAQRLVFQLTDHDGVVRNAFMVAFEPQRLNDVSNLSGQTWKYKLKLIKRPGP